MPQFTIDTFQINFETHDNRDKHLATNWNIKSYSFDDTANDDHIDNKFIYIHC